MSKKKNTLNDLEEFLKLQASTLVTPSSLSEKVKDTPPPKTEQPKSVAAVSSATQELTENDLVKALHQLASDKKAFYHFITHVVESLPNKSNDDVLLINTALYLKGGSQWKEVIREYWKNKNREA
jgi:hypothetical protein